MGIRPLWVTNIKPCWQPCPWAPLLSWVLAVLAGCETTLLSSLLPSRVLPSSGPCQSSLISWVLAVASTPAASTAAASTPAASWTLIVFVAAGPRYSAAFLPPTTVMNPPQISRALQFLYRSPPQESSYRSSSHPASTSWSAADCASAAPSSFTCGSDNVPSRTSPHRSHH